MESEDGRLIKGTIETKDDETFEVTTKDGKVDVPRETLKVFRSEEEQSAYEKRQERIRKPTLTLRTFCNERRLNSQLIAYHELAIAY